MNTAPVPLSSPFPKLDAAELDAWRWPKPPFAWRHEAGADDGAQRCRIDTAFGTSVEGDLVGIDTTAGVVSFRVDAAGAAVQLPFARFCRLTLLAPLKPVARRAGAPLERVPAAAQERVYRIVLKAKGQGGVLEGRTLGRVETAEGLYLYPPVDEERSVLRVLVPRSAYESCEFGPSAEEIAAREWLATPEALLQALGRRKPVLPLGQSLLELGFITPAQLERALRERAGDAPLGETLVAAGILSRTDLQTALAHKMGIPLVDLARFPIDAATVQKLPRRIAVAARALPLMVDGPRMIVAVDRPARLDKLKTLQVFAQLTPVPVLASKLHILMTLARLAQHDVWSSQGFGMPEYFATTN